MGAGIRETPTTFFSSRSRSKHKPRFSFSTLGIPRAAEAGAGDQDWRDNFLDSRWEMCDKIRKEKRYGSRFRCTRPR